MRVRQAIAHALEGGRVVEVMKRGRGAALPLLALCLGLLAPASAAGQDQAASREAPRRLMLAVRQTDAQGLSDEELAVVSRSMLLALKEARANLVMVEPTRAVMDPSASGMSRLAEESGADCWMLVVISGARAEPVLQVHSYDVLNGSTVIDTTVRRAASEPLSVMSLPYERWDDLVALLSGAYAPREATDIPVRDPGKARLTVHALPGTLLGFSDGTRATVGPDGAAVVALAVPAAYQLRATRAGSASLLRTLFIQSDRELAIAQTPVSRFAIDASVLICWPGLAVSYFPVPEQFFVRAGLTTYLVGFVMRPEGVFSSDPLTNLDVLAGAYASPAYAAVRAYLGIGGFVRFMHAPGWPVRLDPLSPAGAQLVAGAETSLGASARFFAEYQPMLYATATPELLRAALRSSAGWFFSRSTGLQLASFRIGIRWLP